MTNEEEIFDEYVKLMRKLFDTGELTEEEWTKRFALHRMIVEIGTYRGEMRRRHLDAQIRKDAHPYE